MPIKIKICGLSTPETVVTAVTAGADFVGLVHFARSPRNVDPDAAGTLADIARGKANIVSLLVDPGDDLVADVIARVRPDFVQLHGHEPPGRVADIALRWHIPVIKAVPVANASDAALAAAYRGIASLIMFDAKPMPGALPGGNGVAFDWSAIAGEADKGPFMLSGGLNAANVAEAISLTGAPIVDVSSGVESAPGVKDPDRIRQFIAAARSSAISPNPSKA
jgi:phosphoribosylanthranilate isomerase